MKFTDSPEFNQLISYIFRVEWIENGKKHSMYSIQDGELADLVIAMEMLNKGITDFKIIEFNSHYIHYDKNL